jgi:predicted nucleotidyltransferase
VISLKISAIIAEYNPLHNGHLYQINKTKELTDCSGLVALMSGNFVQRGEPAVIDKWNRTKIALENGVDLVLELPVIYSLSSAEFFAHGSVSILDKIGVIDSICFGSEVGDISILQNLASILAYEPIEYKEFLKDFLDRGDTYPLARSKALLSYINSKELFPDIDIQTVLSSSNNILGIEYCKSLIKNNSCIKAVTIKREGGAYNSDEPDERFSSATAVRKLIKHNEKVNVLKSHIPEESFKIIEELYKRNYCFTFSSSIFPFIRHKCFNRKSTIEQLPDASEGLHNRIYNAVISSKDYDSAIAKAKTKRYTYTRISRLLNQLYIGFDEFNTDILRNTQPSYARILGFNSTGKEILKMMKKNCDLEIYTKLPSTAGEMLKLDVQSTKMYSLINSNVNYNDDYLISPIIYK